MAVSLPIQATCVTPARGPGGRGSPGGRKTADQDTPIDNGLVVNAIKSASFSTRVHRRQSGRSGVGMGPSIKPGSGPARRAFIDRKIGESGLSSELPAQPNSFDAAGAVDAVTTPGFIEIPEGAMVNTGETVVCRRLQLQARRQQECHSRSEVVTMLQQSVPNRSRRRPLFAPPLNRDTSCTSNVTGGRRRRSPCLLLLVFQPWPTLRTLRPISPVRLLAVG